MNSRLDIVISQLIASGLIILSGFLLGVSGWADPGIAFLESFI